MVYRKTACRARAASGSAAERKARKKREQRDRKIQQKARKQGERRRLLDETSSDSGPEQAPAQSTPTTPFCGPADNGGGPNQDAGNEPGAAAFGRAGSNPFLQDPPPGGFGGCGFGCGWHACGCGAPKKGDGGGGSSSSSAKPRPAAGADAGHQKPDGAADSSSSAKARPAAGGGASDQKGEDGPDMAEGGDCSGRPKIFCPTSGKRTYAIAPFKALEEAESPDASGVSDFDRIQLGMDYLMGFEARTCRNCSRRWFKEPQREGGVGRRPDYLPPVAAAGGWFGEHEEYCGTCWLNGAPTKEALLWNSVDYGQTFPELDALSYVEERCISMVSPIMSVFTNLPGGGCS